MGYYATLHTGGVFTITNPKAVLDQLATHDYNADGTPIPHGGISWCGPVANYRKGTEFTSECAALHNIITDFGFLATIHLPGVTNDDGDTVQPGVHIYGWGDGKLGGSWDDMWKAFAMGTDDEVCWLMIGEDNAMWAEILCGGAHSQAEAEIHVKR